MTLRRAFGSIFILTLVVYALALARPALFLGWIDRLSFATQKDLEASTSVAPAPVDIALADISFPEVDEPLVEDANGEVATETDAEDASRIVIPRMGVNAEVLENDSDAALWQGVWHIPGSAQPGKEGNIVLAAHRWLHKPPHPETFYLIDKLIVGDQIYYDHQGSRYEYRVMKTFIVDPDDVEILRQDENKLTLFTCTPLYSTKQRYVVTAELVNVTGI